MLLQLQINHNLWMARRACQVSRDTKNEAWVPQWGCFLICLARLKFLAKLPDCWSAYEAAGVTPEFSSIILVPWKKSDESWGGGQKDNLNPAVKKECFSNALKMDTTSSSLVRRILSYCDKDVCLCRITKVPMYIRVSLFFKKWTQLWSTIDMMALKPDLVRSS